MTELREGDLLAIMSAGAYGFVMASNYNSRPLAAEALVRGDKFALIGSGKRGKTWCAEKWMQASRYGPPAVRENSARSVIAPFHLRISCSA